MRPLIYFGRGPLENRHPQLMRVPRLGGGYSVAASLSPGIPCTAPATHQGHSKTPLMTPALTLLLCQYKHSLACDADAESFNF